MKPGEVNKVRIGDLVEINKHIVRKVDYIEYYEERGVRIVISDNVGFAWWEISNIFTSEENPEMFI